MRIRELLASFCPSLKLTDNLFMSIKPFRAISYLVNCGFLAQDIQNPPLSFLDNAPFGSYMFSDFSFLRQILIYKLLEPHNQ